MTNATAERDHTTREQEAAAEEARKAAAKAAEEQAERDEDQRRFDALFSFDDQQRRRAALTVAEQPRFDALVMEANRRFAAMTHDERKSYLDAQEKMTPEQRAAAEREARDAPTQQHVYSELLAEFTYIKISNLPIPDRVFNQLVSIVKTYNAEPPPEGGVTRRQRAAAA